MGVGAGGVAGGRGNDGDEDADGWCWWEEWGPDMACDAVCSEQRSKGGVEGWVWNLPIDRVGRRLGTGRRERFETGEGVVGGRGKTKKGPARAE